MAFIGASQSPNSYYQLTYVGMDDTGLSLLVAADATSNSLKAGYRDTFKGRVSMPEPMRTILTIQHSLYVEFGSSPFGRPLRLPSPPTQLAVKVPGCIASLPIVIQRRATTLTVWGRP
jgi:hypothetical protein